MKSGDPKASSLMVENALIGQLDLGLIVLLLTLPIQGPPTVSHPQRDNYPADPPDVEGKTCGAPCSPILTS
jgi:hypothetical protein